MKHSQPPPMVDGTLKALEFNVIVDALARLAVTPLGRRRLAALRPSTDTRRVTAALAATAEGVRFLDSYGTLPLRAPDDLEETLAALAVEGRPLEPRALVGLADFLGSVGETRAAVLRAGGHYPVLRSLAEACAPFETEVADIRRAITPQGEVTDEASPELRHVRERLRKQRARLKTVLESYVRSRETARYLQEPIVTERNGRSVLMLKAEHRHAIPGIVHGVSASGASLFIEPLSSVEINNEVVALEEQEAAEVRRVLVALSEPFRRRALELRRTIDAAAEFDVIQAKARFARRLDATAPVIAPDVRLELRAARHPLLVVADESQEPRQAGGRPQAPAVVPVDIILAPPASALVLTGPNAGGKTVALKTAGLLALMAQAGLFIPAAEGSRVTVFRSIFADIGDEQSIAANLSTFSWHITNIVAMDRALALPALVLLDELGAGTDPAEGGPLGVAIVEHFRQRGALVLVTTHDETLKTYGATTPGVTIAAFGFDQDTGAPTYRLTYGSVGRSLALEMAERLGLSRAIVEAARRQRSEREARLAEQLAKVDRELADLERERRLVERERLELAEAAARLDAREMALRQREDQLRRRLDEALDAQLREARREIESIIGDLKHRAAALLAEAGQRAAGRGQPLSTGEVGALRLTANERVETVVERHRQAALAELSSAAHPAGRSDGERAPATAPAVGHRVAIASLGLEGTVTATFDGEADVDVRGKRLRVPLAELRVVGGPAPGRVNVHVTTQPREATTDLNVIGCTVDEALAKTEKFLDEALLTEQRTVRVIHGHGTGQLRRALAEYLQTHPLVARIQAAAPEHGGTGVTVVELKE